MDIIKILAIILTIMTGLCLGASHTSWIQGNTTDAIYQMLNGIFGMVVITFLAVVDSMEE